MPVKQKIPYDYGVFFITYTCYRWLYLFEITNSYDVVYKWFDELKRMGHLIIGYEIMPNHLHAVIAFRKSRKSINLVVGNGKRLMAYEIVRRLKANNREDILLQISVAVNKSDRSRSKLHEVWENSFDWKYLFNERMIVQKLDYMHWNPCVGKWKLVDSPEQYLHGSAKYYILNEQGYYTITSYAELDDIDLSIPLQIDEGYSLNAASPPPIETRLVNSNTIAAGRLRLRCRWKMKTKKLYTNVSQASLCRPQLTNWQIQNQIEEDGWRDDSPYV